MRTLLFALLLGIAVTAALLWNREAYAPVEVGGGPAARKAVKGPVPLPRDKVVLLLGFPPGAASKGSSSSPSRPKPRSARPGSPSGAGESPARRRPPAKPPVRMPESPAAPLPKPPPVVRKARLQKGETIYSLAKRLLGDGRRYKEILRLNGLDEEKARRLRAGTVLRIPSR